MPDAFTPNGDTGGNAPATSEEAMETLLFKHARTGACPSPDLLFAAQEDVLPEEAGASIREHASHCALCQTLLAELPPAAPGFDASSKSSLDAGASARIRAQIQARIDKRSSLTSDARPPRKPIFRLSILSVAAVAAVVVIGILGILGYRRWRSSASPSTLAANHSPAQPAQSLPDVPELHRIAALAPPDDVDALVMRGAPAHRGPTVEDLLPAFRAYNRGDYAQAAAAFIPLTARFPTSDIPPLYLGVSRLKLEQNADAQRALSQAYALSGAARHEAATWYLAIADLRLNRPIAAIPLLHDLCAQQRNPYAPRACVLARQLSPS